MPKSITAIRFKSMGSTNNILSRIISKEQKSYGSNANYAQKIEVRHGKESKKHWPMPD
jgi:hypothetical protein